MNIRLLILVMAFMVSGCASTTATEAQQAVQDAGTEQGAPAEQVADGEMGDEEATVAELDPGHPDAIRCKKVRKTGTRFFSKVCATNRQWEESERAAGDAVDSMQARPQQGKEF